MDPDEPTTDARSTTDERPTSDDQQTTDEPAPEDVGRLRPSQPFHRYRLGEEIGSGGMGQVLAANDDQIGREVAVKRMKSGLRSDQAIARFLREARIQGRLDHPTVVPVYELGRDGDGRPYFAMKRLTGTTLAKILRGAESDPRFTRQRLLRAFADVCLAIEFAHVRGVIHRDLKPENIVLGNFGEVYVLDWGIAKVRGETDDFSDADGDGVETEVGGVVGTAGYLAPEQAAGDADLDERADVYALGCVLFEILTRQRLHRTSSRRPVLEIDARPSMRTPDADIPPELDQVCVEATATERDQRIASARELGERVQRYIDGDRDHSRRRELARDQIAIANTAFSTGARAEAMRAAGRALALDPEAGDAAELVTRLMLEPPEDPPPQLQVEIDEAAAEVVRARARAATLAYITVAMFLPLAVWAGVREWDVILGIFSMALLMAIAAYRISKQPMRTLAEMFGYVIGNVVLMAMLGRIYGPFVMVPALTVFILTAVSAYPALTVHSGVLIATIVSGFLATLLLEHVGVLTLTWEIRGDALLSHASALDMRGTPSLVLLIAANVMTLVMAGFHAAVVHRATHRARRQLVTQAWQLRQLLPAQVR